MTLLHVKDRDVITMSKDGSVQRKGTPVEYEITIGHCVLPPGKCTQGNDLEEDSAFRRLTHYKSNCSSFLQVLIGPFLACIRHSYLLCHLCLEHYFETVRMRLKVIQSMAEVVR